MYLFSRFTSRIILSMKNIWPPPKFSSLLLVAGWNLYILGNNLYHAFIFSCPWLYVLSFKFLIQFFFFFLSRWNMIAERLGFMLIFGDLVWIPFSFSIQLCVHKYCLDEQTSKIYRSVKKMLIIWCCIMFFWIYSFPFVHFFA